MSSAKKRIDIAVVGSVASGKTFVIEAMVNILSGLRNNIYKPIASDMFELSRTDNGLNTPEFFENIDPSFTTTNAIHAPDFIIDLINTNIADTSLIKTRAEGALYSSVLKKGGNKNTFISFYNISGEAFKYFFEPFPTFSNEADSRPFDLMRRLDNSQKLFWLQNWATSVDNFRNVVEEFYIARGSTFDANAQQYFDTRLRPYYNSFLYACNATDLIFCSDGMGTTVEFTANQVESMNRFLEGKEKNYYRVLTKIDRYLKEEVQLSSLENFEEYYASIITKIREGDYYNSIFNPEQALLVELRGHRSLFGGFLNDGQSLGENNNIKEFVVACNLLYNSMDNQSEFILFDMGNWNQQMNQSRRSIGVRELLSTIFYNNNNTDEIGNLSLVNESLRCFYYF